MPMYRQSLWSHMQSIGNVAKDKHRKRFFTGYYNLYYWRKMNKQRSVFVEGRLADEFQDYMLRSKTGMMNIFQPSIFFPTVRPNIANREMMRVAWIRKPDKLLNIYQITRYMNERTLTDEARLRNAQRVQRHSIV